MVALTPRRVLIAIFVLMAVGWGVERLVITDREEIESLLERSAVAVSHDDWDGFSAGLDETFKADGRDRGAFVNYVAVMKERHKPQGVGLEIGETNVAGDHATTPVVVKPGAPYIGVRLGGRVDLVRTAAGWRLSGIADIETSLLGR